MPEGINRSRAKAAADVLRNELNPAMKETAGVRRDARDAMKDLRAEFRGAATDGKKAAGGINETTAAANRLGGSLKGLVAGGLRAIGILESFSLSKAVEEAKKLDNVTAKLGQSAGTSGAAIRASFDVMEKQTLSSASSMAELARALGRTTYDAKFAAASVGALGNEALAVGRDIADELPLAAALRGMGVQAEELTGELGRLRDMAERVGTVGGHVALKDTLAALAPVLQTVATQTDASRARLEALVAVLGKGLPAQQAQAAASGVLGALKSRAVDFERITGRRVVDDKGQLIDPVQTLKDLKAYVDRKYGKANSRRKRLALMQEGELGSALLNGGFDEVEQLAKQARDRGKTSAEADSFRQSKEGQRIETQLAKDQAMRGVGSAVLSAQDALARALGANTVALLSVGLGLKGLLPSFSGIGGLLGGAGAAGAGSGIAGGAAGGATGGGIAGLLAGVGGLSAAALAAAPVVLGLASSVKVLSEIGEDRDQMGARSLKENEDVISDENRLKRGDRPEDVQFDAMIRRNKKEADSWSFLDLFEKPGARLSNSASTAPPDEESAEWARMSAEAEKTVKNMEADYYKAHGELQVTVNVKPKSSPNSSRGNRSKARK